MNNKVLLVDDEVNILNSYRRTLRNHFAFDVANSGAQALQMLSKDPNYAVIVSDMQMPNMNGIELLKKTKEISPNTVRMMLTGNADQKTAIDAVNIGDIFRFINKPCPPATLAQNITAGIKQYNLIISEKVLLNQTLKGVINVLNEVLTVVNPNIYSHITKLKKYMMNLAKALKLPKTWWFEPMIQLSQLGYIMFPGHDAVSANSQNKMQLNDRKLIEKHPLLSSDLICRIPRLKNIAHIILYQEKCFNGDGVPFDNVKGEEIPYAARMLKIVLDYMRYKNEGVSNEQAFMKLETHKEFYDPKILAIFESTLDIQDRSSQELVKLTELTDNMVIQESLQTRAGLLVAAKGQEVTEALRRIISHCIQNGALEGSVIVSKNYDYM